MNGRLQYDERQVMEAVGWSEWGSSHEEGNTFLKRKQRKIKICFELALSIDHHELGEDANHHPILQD